MAGFRIADFRLSSRPIEPRFAIKSYHAELSLLWIFWSCALAFAWLLPNHYLPWPAFHSDAWSALVMGSAFAALFFMGGGTIAWHEMSVVSAVLVSIPLAQHALGILPFSGQAWISSLYLLGLLLAMLAGSRWEGNRPGQLADAVFLAIGVASILSVGLQLRQWLGTSGPDLGGFNFWTVGLVGGRPYANLSQANQLATLLLWGLLASMWGVLREKIRAPFAVLMACFLCIGIALTGSRTAWIGLFLMVCAAWMGRKWWPSKWGPLIVSSIAAFFVLVHWLLRLVEQLLKFSTLEDIGQRLHDAAVRPTVWRMFVDAIGQHPWLGYGWSGVAKAQLAVALDHPPIHMIFAESHNLFLDLVLWCGLPLGLAISGVIVWWGIRCIRHTNDLEMLVLLMFVIVVGNHAMLEFPLQYAYFLLPTGMMIGALDVRCKTPPVMTTSRHVFIGIWIIAAVLFSAVVRDYFRVEQSYRSIRFDEAHIGKPMMETLPKVMVLTQWEAFLKFVRMSPRSHMSESNIAWAREVVETYPGRGQLHRLAVMLALNGKPDDARLTLEKMCSMIPPGDCTFMREVWRKYAEHDPKIAAVKWPQ